jgi:hypothetical protein
LLEVKRLKRRKKENAWKLFFQQNEQDNIKIVNIFVNLCNMFRMEDACFFVSVVPTNKILMLPRARLFCQITIFSPMGFTQAFVLENVIYNKIFIDVRQYP